MIGQVERRSGRDRRSLTGVQKAAALLIAMGEEFAPRVLKHLSEDEIKSLTKAAATLGVIDPPGLEAIIEEFQRDLQEGPEIVGDAAQARNLASGALSDEAVASVLDELGDAPQVDVWARLNEAGATVLNALLAAEAIGVQAYVLSRLGADPAAAAIAAMEADARADVLAFMARGVQPARAICEAIENALAGQDLSESVASGGGDAAGRVAAIVNKMDPADADGALGALADRAPEAAAAVRALVFRFEDIGMLTAEERSALFDQIATEKVILALKTADPALVEAVLGSLGARARRMVEAEISSGQSAPAREVASARRSIVEAALRLAQNGVLTLPGARGVGG